MKKVIIVGYGRFGKTLEKLLEGDFDLVIVHKDSDQSVISKADAIFYCIPISAFESVVKSHLKYLKDDQVLIDVLSVKIHPKKVLSRLLKGKKTQAILTHPMFGPDSSREGFSGLPLIMDRFKSDEKTFSFWKKFFVNRGLRVIEMDARTHDRLAANSQGLTHFVGRLLEKFGLKKTEIDSLGAKKLQGVMDQTVNDTWQLFKDLQNYNPYTKPMRNKIGRTYDLLYNELLPKRISKRMTVFGIQGGKGSFNEEAVNDYIKRNGIKKHKIKYLYTTEKVLKNLHEGSIDLGIFAIQNAVGGVVEESTHAMARYKFKIVSEFQIMIRHNLMKRKDVKTEEIRIIMAHSQNFRQCKDNLDRKFPRLGRITGKDDLMDTAMAARALSLGKIPKNTAILGPRILSEIYGLDIVDENLQDSKNNLTTFFAVSR
jgi:prephenate dehydrogenase